MTYLIITLLVSGVFFLVRGAVLARGPVSFRVPRRAVIATGGAAVAAAMMAIPFITSKEGPTEQLTRGHLRTPTPRVATSEEADRTPAFGGAPVGSAPGPAAASPSRRGARPAPGRARPPEQASSTDDGPRPRPTKEPKDDKDDDDDEETPAPTTAATPGATPAPSATAGADDKDDKKGHGD